MRTIPRHRRPSGAGRILKLAGLWLVILGAGGGLAAAGIIAMNRPPDPVALCRQGRVVSSTLVLIDATDALTEIQRRRLRATVEAERDRLPRAGKLTLLVLNPADPAQPAEQVSVCNPGRAADADPLFNTGSRIDREWREAFGGPIESALAGAAAAAPAAASPIIATIAGALTRPDFDARVRERRLVVVSDLLEHSKGGYSQLAGGNFWKAYAGSALARESALDLHGVTVAVDYLIRPRYAAIQGEAHRRFWTRLFEDAGATATAFIGMRAAEPDDPSPGRGARVARQSGRL